MNINKEKAKELGQIGWTIGKTILIAGTQLVVVNAVKVLATTFIRDGKTGVKALTLDDYLERE